MKNATMIVPVGNFTPDLSRRVGEAAFATATRRDVVIAMNWTKLHSWSGLCQLAESLRGAVTPYRIRLARALPQTRALLGELGIEKSWFIDDPEAATDTRILICA